MMTLGDYVHAAEYEELALVAEHEDALGREAADDTYRPPPAAWASGGVYRALVAARRSKLLRSAARQATSTPPAPPRHVMMIEPFLYRSTVVLCVDAFADDPAAIAARLRAGGATHLRTTSTPTWIIGRAPSGIVFELLHWPTYAYCVTRHSSPGQLVQHFGVFPTWKDAGDYALQS